MTSPILVTGGTGTLGRLVVARLRDAGRDVRVLSRHPKEVADGIDYYAADLATGEGAAAALEGVEVVVHCAGSSKGDDDKARNLVAAIKKAGTSPHIVNVSVVGADRTPMASGIDRTMFGYVGAKLDAEKIIAGSGLPWTTLRATQFHELILQMAQGMAKLPVLPMPTGTSAQPIAAAEVADRLVELALGRPAGLVAEIGGPRIYPMADLIRDYLRTVGKRRPVLPIRLPGKAAKAFRAGANLTPDHATGQVTWETFLANQPVVASRA